MAEKILIIDDDVDTLRLVGLMLQKQGYVIVAANNGPLGIEQAEKENPDLILLDIMMPELDGYEVARRIRNNPLTTNIPILMFTAKTQLDDKVTGFEAGADDYLTKPTHPTELQAHVKALLARMIKGKMTPAPMVPEKQAMTVGVLSPRGGQGVSTVAVNLGHALRLLTKTEVIVAELRPGMGSIGPDMGEPDPKALKVLLSGNGSELTKQKVRDNLYIHETGLRLIFGSTRPKDAGLMNSVAPMETLVKRLDSLTPYLVLDLGASLTPVTQKLLPYCEMIFLLVEPVPNAVDHSRLLMDDLLELGVQRRSIKVVVVNRVRSDTQLTMTAIEDHLGQAPVLAITPAPELMYLAARNKTTAIGVRPDSLTAQQFTRLASLVLEYEKQK
jgi:pilus assembly protein CpaE